MPKCVSWLRDKFAKALFALGAAVFLSTAAYAEGESGFDVGIATQFLTKAETTVTSFWSTNQTAILAILGIIVGLSVLWMIVKIVRKATGKAG